MAFILGGVALVALLLGGHLVAPVLMEPPVDLATPRGLAPGELPAGAAALEAAFWLTALLSAVLNFRVLELLFRRPDVIGLQSLPIQPRALFFDRLLAALAEALLASLGTATFFVPLLWHGGAGAFIASALMLIGGLTLGTILSLAILLLSAQQLVPRNERRGPSLGADSLSGSGQILLYAPAMALASVIVAALFWKLLLGEPLRLGRLSEPFYIGTAILGAVGLGSFNFAYRAFKNGYYAMAPRFREADVAEFSALLNYQQSAFEKPSLWEFGLSRQVRATTRALLLDDGRRSATNRIGYAIALILAVFGLATLDLAALPGWALAMVPAILVAALFNPWRRIFSRAERIHIPMALPASAQERKSAASRAALREFMLIALPYTAALVIIPGYFRGLGTAVIPLILLAIFSGPAIAGAIRMATTFGIKPAALGWLAPFFTALLLAAAIFSIPLALMISIATALLALPISSRSRHRHV